LADLQATLAWAQTQLIGVTLLGAGSNLLISDRGLPGLVLSTRYLRDTWFNEAAGEVTVGAGEPIARLAWRAAKRGWSGLEWAVGIPGSVGGAVVMNAGAQGGCTADILKSALIMTGHQETLVLEPPSLGFGYRISQLQKQSIGMALDQMRLVVQATFQLQPGFDPKVVMLETTANLHQRRQSQPYNLPSCGSVFCNPRDQAAGWLIEQAGLKGYQIGQAQVSHRHANFILNCGGARSHDIFQLISHVQEQVERRWQLQLFGFGFNKMKELAEAVKKAQQVQEGARELQEELEQMEIEGQAHNGMVKVFLSGNQEPRRVEIKPEAFQKSPEDVSKLVLTAMQQAYQKSTDTMRDRMEGLTAGLDIPGL